MNKIKSIVLFSISAFILLFTSCGGMTVERADDITIDLSAVIEKAGDNEAGWAKVRLVALGTSNFYPLSDDQTLQELSAGTISLKKIPVGSYTIYISVGTYNETEDIFAASTAISGDISVTGGAVTEAVLIAEPVKAASIFSRKDVIGVAHNGTDFYTIIGNELYKGTVSAAADPGFTFNHLNSGIWGRIIISCANSDGYGFVTYDEEINLNTEFATGMAAGIEGEDKSVDVISADVYVFTDEFEEVELILGQTNGGLVFHIEKFGEVNNNEWIVLDLGKFMEDAGIQLKGKLINGITVVKQKTGEDVTDLWIYLASQAGDFRIKLPLDVTGFEITPEGDETEAEAVLKLFEPFKDGNDLEDRNILDIDTPGGNVLYVATDQGLFRASATELAADMNPAVVAGTEGKRIEILAVGDNFTACVTALKIYILRHSDDAVRSVAFNDGLPVEGLMIGGAVSGLAWDNAENILYIAGDNGLASLDMDILF